MHACFERYMCVRVYIRGGVWAGERGRECESETAVKTMFTYLFN